MKIGRTLFVLLVLVWLALKLSGIGWREVWHSRPRTPWFYLCWLGLYLHLPLVEAFIYRALWKVPPRDSIFPLLHKRTLNQDLVSGSGEAFLFLWARSRVKLPEGRIAGTIKDSVIASSFAYWCSMGVLVLFAGRIVLSALLSESSPQLVVVAVALVVALLALGIWLRRRILSLSPRSFLWLFLVHFCRVVLFVFLLQIVQWWVVLPEVALQMWIPMLVVITAISRVPFIPAKDLVSVGAVLSMLALPATYEATIAAMLLTRTVLDKACNLTVSTANFALGRIRRGRD